MKNFMMIVSIGIALFVLTFFIWQYRTQFSSKPHVIQDTESGAVGNYLGSYYKGNYVWGGAMNLAWNELNEAILREKLKLSTDDKTALEMVSKLNNSPFSKIDLDEESYYIKSGYGQSTVDEINRESKKKFPSKPFKDLQIELSSNDIISYAFFSKEVEYETSFENNSTMFNGKKVKGFIANTEEQRKNVRIIKYENDDKFIIKLQLKDVNDELILAKGYDMADPQGIVNEIAENNKPYLLAIGETDRFLAPKVKLDYHRDYDELIGKKISNNGFTNYHITQMFENIKFEMDEKGARVANEAVMIMGKGMNLEEQKNFILDKPYWIVMKRASSRNPYFILGLNNSELMDLE